MKSVRKCVKFIIFNIIVCVYITRAVMQKLVCRSSTYSLAVGPNGQKCCPIQQADIVIERVSTRNLCGNACLESNSCLSYTFYDDTTRCEIYTKSVPTFDIYEPVDHCWNYIVCNI